MSTIERLQINWLNSLFSFILICLIIKKVFNNYSIYSLNCTKFLDFDKNSY